MMTVLQLLMLSALFAVLNRIRGGGFFGDKLPGRALWWVAPIIGAMVALYADDATLGVIWAAGYIIWAAPEWGRWFTMGHRARVGEPSTFARVIEAFGGNNDTICFFVRQLLVAPLVLASAWWLDSPNMLWFIVLAPFGASVLYKYAWYEYTHKNIDDPIEFAELLCGVCSTAMLIPLG